MPRGHRDRAWPDDGSLVARAPCGRLPGDRQARAAHAPPCRVEEDSETLAGCCTDDLAKFPRCGHELIERYFDHLLRLPVLQLNGPVFQTLCADDDSKRHTEEIGVLEFHAGAETLTVVMQDFETGGFEVALGPFGSRGDVGIAGIQTQQMHVERRDL